MIDYPGMHNKESQVPGLRLGECRAIVFLGLGFRV